jgi:hypothetical protein
VRRAAPRGVVEAVGHCHGHPAAGDLQVERLVEAGAAVLDQHVLAGDAEVGRAVLDVGRRIGGAHDDQAHIGAIGVEDEFARGFRIVGRHDACRRQQRQGFLEDAALGEGDGDAGHGGLSVH